MNEFQVALEYHQKGEFLLAKNSYESILNRDPGNHNILHLLGVVYYQLGDNKVAVGMISRAIGIDSGVADYYNSLGEVFRSMGLLDESILCYEIAVSKDISNNTFCSNLARSLTEKGCIDKAISTFMQYLELCPGDAFAHHDLSLLYLLNGNFTDGWAEYEWRFSCFKEQRVFDKPRWDGSDISGSTILLYSEQGLGDTIQFVRYVPLVKKLGVKVIFECCNSLESLFNGVSGIDTLVVRGDSLPKFDYQISLMSLPYLFKTLLSSIPANVPYINPSSDIVQKWGSKFRSVKGLKVGLVWSGNTIRNVSLSDFASLGTVPGVSIYSLQVGNRCCEVDNSPFSIVDIAKYINDFSDTAAIIENLDLIISVDTSVAHLAGAMNKPVWLILLFVPDWRWMLNRSDSPWYPSMRLFRQCSRDSGWSRVIRLIADELRMYVKVNSVVK